MSNEYFPKEMSAPWNTVADWLEENDKTCGDLARLLGWTELRLYLEMIKHEPWSSETTQKISELTGIPGEFWEAREARYREWWNSSEE